MGRSALWRDGWPFSKWPNVPYQLNRNSPQARGLVAWWPTTGIGLGTDPDLKDRSGHGYDMTAVNTPMVVTDGQMGRAVLYNAGASEYLKITSAVVTAEPFTLCCWAYVTTAGRIAYMSIADKDVANRYHSLSWDSTPEGGGPAAVVARSYDGTVFDAPTSTSRTLNVWEHVCGVWAAANDRRAYINGGHKGTDANASGASAGIDCAQISGLADSTPGGYVSGRIADARIYNRALTDQEVLDLYLNPWELYEPVIRWWAGYTGGGTPVVPDWPGGYRRVAVGVGAGVLTVDR